MNSRERVLTALNHQEPDRVPFDMGGTVVTGIHYRAYEALRAYLGLLQREPKIIDMIQLLAQVDEDVMERLGVDVRNISPRSSASHKIEFGNISAGIFELLTWLRGYEDAYADWGLASPVATKLMDRCLQLQLAYWEKALSIVGDVIDVAQIADDIAGQNGLLISPRSYRKLLKPLHKELCDFIHARTKAKIFMHSCGAIRPVIPDFIEIGIDIINPVQVSAAGMDSAQLKRDFGKDITFWGGGVDTQRVLGTGSPQQVRDEVKRRLDDFMPGGGFIFNTVHNIQGNVPPENLMAMWETVQDCGRYRSE